MISEQTKVIEALRGPTESQAKKIDEYNQLLKKIDKNKSIELLCTMVHQQSFEELHAAQGTYDTNKCLKNLRALQDLELQHRNAFYAIERARLKIELYTVRAEKLHKRLKHML